MTLSLLLKRTALFFLFLVPNFLLGQVSVIGELSQDKMARPGETYTGSIIIRNDTNEPQEAKVYQTDYTFHYSGTNNYGDPGSMPRSNAKWVTFSPAYLTLPPASTMAIDYSVAVPKDLTGKPLIGTYWSMLMVEGIQKGSAESSLRQKDTKAQMGIMQTIRYGIQIATSIANTGTKKVNFIGAKLVAKEEGKRALQIDIENTGELVMRPDVTVDLFDEKGVARGKFEGVKYRIYPGTSVRQTIDVSSVTPGNYKARVVVDAGGDDIFGAEYVLKF
ncbi:MAG TPA: hypothetical protein VMM57_01620 [Bacteroidota bacterium]|nr:hypothetical protein [Bacteroidota bacterium]